MSAAAEIIVAKPLALSLEWDGDVLSFMRLSWAGEGETSRIETASGRELAEALTRYVAGDAPEWPELPIDFAALPRFHYVLDIQDEGLWYVYNVATPGELARFQST